MNHLETPAALPRTIDQVDGSASDAVDSFDGSVFLPEAERRRRWRFKHCDARRNSLTPVSRKLNGVQLRSASARRLFSIRGETRQIRIRGFPGRTNNLSHVVPNKLASQ